MSSFAEGVLGTIGALAVILLAVLVIVRVMSLPPKDLRRGKRPRP